MGELSAGGVLQGWEQEALCWPFQKANSADQAEQEEKALPCWICTTRMGFWG